MDPIIKNITITLRTEFEGKIQTVVFQMDPVVFQMNQYRPVIRSEDRLAPWDRTFLVLQGEALTSHFFKDETCHPTLASWLEALLATKQAGNRVNAGGDPIRRTLAFTDCETGEAHSICLAEVKRGLGQVETLAQQFGLTLDELREKFQTPEGRTSLCLPMVPLSID